MAWLEMHYTGNYRSWVETAALNNVPGTLHEGSLSWAKNNGRE
jgi:hypothetical protein